MGHAAVLLRRDHVRRRARLLRLPPALLSHQFYGGLGATTANVLVGLLSAVPDNIPMMVAVLQMAPSMDHGRWLLVTFTAGVGGSLLSIGSAAGVALMGHADAYTYSATPAELGDRAGLCRRHRPAPAGERAPFHRRAVNRAA